MFPEKILIPCPVCGSKDFKIVYEPWIEELDPAKLYGTATGIHGTQRLVTCKNCGLLYENPRYGEDVIVGGYMTSEDPGHDSQYGMRVRSFFRALKKLAPKLPPSGSKILDIGSASGAFLEAASRFGYEAFGLEPSHFRVSKARERGLQAVQGVIENHDFAPESFDMVTLWDVIEHLPNPSDALRRIHGLLKPGGILLLNFPDIDTWQARLAGKHFWWILSAHLAQFAPSTITQICERCGFQTYHFQPYWQALEFGYLERMARTYYKIPFAGLVERLTPGWLSRTALPFYASQTTGLAKRIEI